MSRAAKLEKRLSSVALVNYAASTTGSCGGSSARTRTPPSGRRASSVSSAVLFNEWVDDEQQRHGQAFEFVEDEETLLDPPLTPLIGPAGWSDDVRAEIRDGMPKGKLGFVEGTSFRLLVGAVILSNTVLILSAAARPQWSWIVEATDTSFLSFYLGEIAIRIAHHQARFFYIWPDWPWNWIDLIIVTAGILDNWVLSASRWGHEGHSDAVMGLRIIQPLRLLFRAARLLRLVKLIRVFFVLDLAWVEGRAFQYFVAFVILVNALVMGLETDLESSAWWWVEQVMLAFFATELAFRIRLKLCAFFTEREGRLWNILDLAIVVTGISTQWVLDIWVDEGSSQWTKMVSLARMLRLMRIIRLFRLAKAVRPLRQLTIGVASAMQSMFWVLVLTFAVLYSLAIAMTRMVGWGELVDDPNSIPEETRAMFSSLTESMFALFALMNGHQWHQVTPLLELLPWTKPLFVAFTICGSWALLSVMTGVVSDHIQSIREKDLREDEEMREERKEKLVSMLAQLFASASDGTGSLTRAAFKEIFRSPYHHRRLQRALNQPLDDVQLMFDWLDVEGRGTLDFYEFCEGLECLEEMVTGRSLLTVDCGVKRQCNLLQKGIELASDEVDALQRDLDHQHAELMSLLRRAMDPKDDHSYTFNSSAASAGSAPGSTIGKSLSDRSNKSSGDNSLLERVPSQNFSEEHFLPVPNQKPPSRFRMQKSISSLRSQSTENSKQPARLKYHKSVSFSCEDHSAM